MNKLVRFTVFLFLLIPFASQAADLHYQPGSTIAETPGLVRGAEELQDHPFSGFVHTFAVP